MHSIRDDNDDDDLSIVFMAGVCLVG